MLDLLLAVALLPQGPGTSTAPVVINEFSYDDSGVDDFEFVELYNRSGAPVDISGWRLVNRDPGSPAYGGSGVDPSHVVPAGTVLAPGAFYLFANAAMLPGGPVPGVSQLLPQDGLENGPAESIELLDALNNIVDSVAYELGGVGVFGSAPYGPHPLEGDGFFGDLVVGNGIGQPSVSIARHLDGYDNDDNGKDFSVCAQPTPGASNVLPSVLPFFDTFETGVAGALIGGWTRGFVGPIYVDPTQVSANNLVAKPPSPQGGLAMVTWDPSGGGNAVALETAPIADVVVETYVFVEPIMAPFNPALYTPSVPPVLLDHYNYADGEFWALGVRGSCAANANPPDAGGYWAAIQPGVGTRYHFLAGIAWCHFRTPTFSRLYLIDFNNGSAPGDGPGNQDFTILAGPIDIIAGVNDGWQRLRLHVQGDKVAGNFGGTFGFDDGVAFTATTSTTGPGAVYIAYREAVLYNSNGLAGCHPPVFDQFDVHGPATAVTFLGTGSPTSVSTPQIETRGFPIPGTSTFAFLGKSMVPATNPGYAFCGLVLGFQTVPPGFAIPGAPATALGYIVPVASVAGFADAAGNVTFPFPMPVNANFLGTQLGSQLVDFDLSLPAGLPIGVSRGMVVTVGN